MSLLSFLSHPNSPCRSVGQTVAVAKRIGFFSPPVTRNAVAVAVGCACLLAVRPAAAERWTSLSGSHTVDANFVGLWGNQVVLELPDQRRVSVQLENLIAESRIQARRLAEQHQQRRSEVKQQILGEAEEAAAPAPTPLPQPPAAPAYTKLTPSGGVLEQLEWFEQQKRNGHVVLAAFDSLPANHQNDLERMIRTTTEQMDLQSLGRATASLQSLGDLVVTRQRWFFSHPRFKALDPGMKDNLKGLILAVAGMLRDGLDPEQLNLEAIENTPLRTWLSEFDQRVAPHLAQLYTQLDLIGVLQPSYDVKQERDGKATVELSVADTKRTLQFVSVDGVWVPQDLAEEQWKEKVAQWEQPTEPSDAAAANASMMPNASMMLDAVPTLVDARTQPARAAQSAREFHTVMDGWIAAVAPYMAQLESLNPLSSPRGGYGGGYEGMMEMEMDMEMMEMEMQMESEQQMMEAEGMQGR